MITLAGMFNAINVDVEKSSEDILRDGCRAIIVAQFLSKTGTDVLMGVADFGPMFQLNVDAVAKCQLVELGLIAEVVVHVADENKYVHSLACTPKGHNVCRIIKAIEEETKE